MLVCASFCASMHTRPRVQRAPGLPCALLFEGRSEFANLGRSVSRERRAHISSSSRPPSRDPYSACGLVLSFNNNARDYGSRLKAGTTAYFVIASGAKQSRATKQDWIASSLTLLAMTDLPQPAAISERISARSSSISLRPFLVSTCQKVQPLQAPEPCATAPMRWIEPTLSPSMMAPSARTKAP